VFFPTARIPWIPACRRRRSQHSTSRPGRRRISTSLPAQVEVRVRPFATNSSRRTVSRMTATGVTERATFCRVQISGTEELLVDIALDATPGHPPVASIAGPALDSSELARREGIALFDRAGARDFADLFVLSSSSGETRLTNLAAEVDAGFDPQVHADMFGLLTRYIDRDLPLGGTDPSPLRNFFAERAAEIRTNPG
jgi:hypothetical protein